MTDPAATPRFLRLAPLLATLALAVGIILAAGPFAPAATSELWGSAGELWSPASRLPDYSFAGYRSAAAPIPSPAVVANVTDFGAVGDGLADDTNAFENAIAAATNGAVLVPAGRYKITRVLYIRKSNLVLRGAGQGLTTLVFPKHLTELLGPPPGSAGLESWSWSGGLIWVEGKETTTKLADVTDPADRGSDTLALSSTAGLAIGQTIRLTMTDPDGSLGRHLNADQLDAHPTLVGRRLVRFPARIAAINGNTITLDRPLRLDVRTAWTPEIRSFTGQLEEVGLEGFTLEFPATRYGGHFQEPGFNGIWMDGVANSWVRDVTVHNGDSAIMLERSLFSTVANVTLTGDVARRFPTNGTYYTGHHGIQLRRSDDCLITDFSIATRFYHDLTVEDATGCVFMKGSGVDVNFDHHTYLPYENLFTEINVGAGTRHFASSGSRNPESAARETLWNIASTNAITTLPNPSPSRGLWPQANFIGINTTLTTTRDPANAWIEAIAPADLGPANLYEAQLARRLSPPPVVPRSATWDGSDVGTAGAQGGGGIWDASTTANWWNGSANEAWPASGNTADHAIFSGSAGTVAVSPAGVVANDITVSTANYLFTGGPIVLNGDSPTFDISGGGSCNVEAVIAGSSGLTKTGISTLHLRAANRYQGDTRLIQGILLIGAGGNRLPVTTRLILGDGANSGTFQMNSRSQQVGGLLTRGTGTANRVINTNAVAPTFTVHLANATDSDHFAGTLGGTTTNDNNYHFTKSGPGRLIVAGDCTYTGLTTINGGTLQIGNDGPAGTPAPAAISNHGILRFDRSGTLTVPNEITGSGALVVDSPSVSAGTIELRGDNSFTGDVTVSGGTLGIDRASALGSGTKSVNLTTGLGSLRFDGDGIALPATITLNLSGEASPGRIQNPAGNNTIEGPINLSIGAGNTLVTSDGGSLTLAGTITAPSANRTLKLAGSSTGDNRISGAIAETAGRTITLEKSGTGTWTLAGPNTHSGTTTVTAGTLRLSHDSALGTTDAATTIHTGAKLQLDGTSLQIAENLTLGTGTTGTTVENLSGDNTLSGHITRNGVLTLISAAGKLDVQSDIGDTSEPLNLQGDSNGEITGSITTASTVTKTGNGAWTLTGANTYTGTTMINGGTLVASTIADTGSSSIGWSGLANALTFGSSSGKLHFNGTTGTTTRAMTFTGHGTFDIADGSALTVGTTGTATATLTNGAWTGNGGITKNGDGTLTVRNNSTTRSGGLTFNSITGGTFTMQAGTLNLSPQHNANSAHAVIGDSSGNPGIFNQTGGAVNFTPLNASTLNYFYVGITSPGTLNVSGGSFTADSTKSGGIQVARGTAGTLTIGGGPETAWVDTPAVNFGLSAAGTGTLNLLTNGILLTSKISVNSGINNANFDGGTLKAKSSTTTFMAGLTTATLTSNGLTVDTDAFNVTIAQSLSGSGGTLTKSGSGTLTLPGTHTHTGATTINAGKLVLSGSLTSPITVANGTLAPQGNPTSGSSLNLQANGRLEVRPGDTLTVGSSVTLAGHLDLVAPHGLPAASRHTILRKSSAGPISGTFTGKPEGAVFSASGSEWRISYLGGDGNDIVLTVLPENAIEQWRQLHFGSSAHTGDGADDADPNNDGEINLIEFTTGQDPRAATRAATFLTAPPASGFTYTRSRAAFLDGYLFSVEYSDTLAAPWTSVGPGTVTLDAPLQSVHAAIPAGPNGRRFARLRVTAP